MLRPASSPESRPRAAALWTAAPCLDSRLASITLYERDTTLCGRFGVLWLVESQTGKTLCRKRQNTTTHSPRASWLARRRCTEIWSYSISTACLVVITRSMIDGLIKGMADRYNYGNNTRSRIRNRTFNENRNRKKTLTKCSEIFGNIKFQKQTKYAYVGVT